MLPALLESYNNTYHRAIGRAPNSVNAENQEAVWLTLYADPELRKTKLKLGDQVRLSMTRMRFRKGYLPGWTKNCFKSLECFDTILLITKLKICKESGWKELSTKKSSRKSIKKTMCFESSVF